VTQNDARRLSDAFTHAFGGQADIEEINSGQFRFTVLSERFSGMPHLRRQDEAWKIIDSTLSPEQVLDVTLVLTFSPDDVRLAPAV